VSLAIQHTSTWSRVPAHVSSLNTMSHKEKEALRPRAAPERKQLAPQELRQRRTRYVETGTAVVTRLPCIKGTGSA
jgi:hypothetical protein